MKELHLLQNLNKKLQNNLTLQFVELLTRYKQKLAAEDAQEELKSNLHHYSQVLKNSK